MGIVEKAVKSMVYRSVAEDKDVQKLINRMIDKRLEMRRVDGEVDEEQQDNGGEENV